MKMAFDNIQSQRQIFQVDISNKTNEMFDRNEIESKAKLTVVYLTLTEGFIHTIQQLSIQNLLSLVSFFCY